MLKDYSNIKFVLEDGSLNLVTCPVRNTASIATLLPERIGQDIIDIGVARLYPPEYFCPLEPSGVKFRKTENTYSVHWFRASWLSDEEMIVHEWKIFRGECEKRLGKKVGSLLARVVYLFFATEKKCIEKA